MADDRLAMGIDLGTSGVRVVLINSQIELVYSASINYNLGLEECKDWERCCESLINNIPTKLKQKLKGIAIDATSGTIIACDNNGKPIGKAITYYEDYSESYINQLKGFSKENLKKYSSLGSALKLIERHGENLLLRSQADWVSSWLTGKWELGEEGNNLKLGWDPYNKSWPKIFYNHSLKKMVPEIISSGNQLGKINIKRSKVLGLPNDVIIIAGTTDSNAAVIAANASDSEGISILGSTIVLKKFVEKPIFAEGITNHLVGGKWICGGSSNSGGAVLRKFFNDQEIEDLSNQINPYKSSNINLLPLPFKGERFPINDPNLKPILTPRPISDSLYLKALLEGLANIEKQGWQKLADLGINQPTKIITLGNGARNIQWQKIRERIIQIPIRICKRPPAIGVAKIAANSIFE
ncbi:FGGY-family carbohydrate kinase [Prochlorococcus sp. MIT 1223]|uniref:FGGY-family carbohydrate kinase n=1 Tax=Prochlorococcus sp. MIT 1223 TaxID=3096217 RepID=UPI002A75F37C|nr:FGGY-family carbohydrate kinase [Prochlorococcus sp. MIT 1223]